MGARGLILLPSRELALQTQKVVQELGRHAALPRRASAVQCCSMLP